MFGKCDSGIELIEENIGKLLNSGTYLFMGERETGKSSFVLQFILQGLKEGKTCLVVTAGLPRDFVIYAESLGMDVS
ncbi:MAG: ATPase domain-containing protein, partial [Candidatus Firestonebacteria bacterium]